VTRRLTPLRTVFPLVMVGAAVALSACQTQSPVQTNYTYNPADGVPVDLGAVQVRDLVVVSSGQGKPGVLSGAISNTGSDTARVAFALPNAQPVYTEAKPHSQENLAGGSGQVQLPTVPVAPGGVVTLTVQSPKAPTAVVTVPVLPPNLYYATITPTSNPSSTTTTAP
jgi:hypothetical protein